MNWRVAGRPLCVALLVMVSVGGCAGQQAPARRVNQSGYSAAFKQGYADGCDSAQSTRRRDERRYRGDTDYMMGWNDGYSACGRH